MNLRANRHGQSRMVKDPGPNNANGRSDGPRSGEGRAPPVALKFLSVSRGFSSMRWDHRRGAMSRAPRFWLPPIGFFRLDRQAAHPGARPRNSRRTGKAIEHATAAVQDISIRSVSPQRILDIHASRRAIRICQQVKSPHPQAAGFHAASIPAALMLLAKSEGTFSAGTNECP